MTALPFALRDALHGFRRDRAFALTVVATLALTIGAVTAVFSIVDGVLLKPLDYPEASRLVALHEVWRQFQGNAPAIEVNEQHFEYWRTHARNFDAMAQYIVLPANLTGVGEPAEIAVARASGSFFDVLRTPSALGRTFTPADEPSGRPDVAVLSDACWRRRFGSDPGIVGRRIVIDGAPRTIVGVLRPDFALPSVRSRLGAEAFVPIHMDAEHVGWWGDHNNDAIARLRPGVTPEQARAELDVLQRQVSVLATNEAHEAITLSSAVTPLSDAIVGQARRGLLLLLGAIAAVLLIACSNLANLSLTREIRRAREGAVRAALGASRARLVGGAALEQLLLAAAGGGLGLGVAWAALRVFVRTAPIDIPRVGDVALDGRVLAFAAALSVAAGAIVAVVPAGRAARRDVERTLRAGALATTTDRGGARARTALLAAQVALSLALVVVTVLLATSFVRVMHIDRGFAVDRVLLVPVSLPADRYATEPSLVTAYDRLLTAIAAVPGVMSATTLSLAPLTGSGQVNTIAPENTARPRSEQPSANFRFVAPGFFRTMGIAVLRGRAFDETDRLPGRPMPALVSEQTAARLWPHEDAIGRRFSRDLPGEAGFEVVGIAADTKITSLERASPLLVYLPYWWRARANTSVVVKAAVDPLALAAPLGRAIHGVDQNIAVGEPRPLAQIVDASIAPRRYQMRLFVAFGAVALFIAIIGVYAVTAYGISERRREMHIRAALGARAGQLLGRAMRQSLVPIAAGVSAGTALAVGMGRVVAGLLFEVAPRDPAILGAAVAIVASVSVLACLVAAKQVLAIEPAEALRD